MCRLAKGCNFPSQLLAVDQFDMTPKASSFIIEVWANRTAQQAGGAVGIQDFVMPADPLRVLEDMTGNRWDKFHSGSQDFRYRAAAGIVAATNGSIAKDEDGNVLMGGGVVYRAGDHGCSDKCVLVRGHISSLVAEGAAALCLLTNTHH